MAMALRGSSPSMASLGSPRRIQGLSVSRAAPMICKALKQKDAVAAKSDLEEPHRHFAASLAMPLAGFVAAAMLAGALIPEEAMAARSGGRVGGGGFSSGRSMGRSAAPSRSAPAPAPSAAGRTYNSYTYAAPPVIVSPGYGYGMSPFGGFMPSYGVVGFGGGGLLQFFFLMVAVSVVFNVISSVSSAVSSGKEDGKGMDKSDKDGDGWGDL